MEKARILIVEDEAIIAMEIESQLQGLGYEVTSIVDTGEKAIEKAEEDKPLILMDIRIKGEMDGIDTAEVIRNRFGIPVIFSTAYLDQERIERAKITMPFGYVLKPIQERDLRVMIEMALYVSKIDKERKNVEQLNRMLMDSLPHPAMLIKKNRTVLASNKIAQELGVTIGTKCWKTFGNSLYIQEDNKQLVKEGKEPINPQCHFCLANESIYEKCLMNDPEVITSGVFDTYWVHVEDDIFLHYSVDITERKQTENALKESEERSNLLLKATREWLCFHDQGLVLHSNERLVEIFGYDSLEEILELKINVIQFAAPESRELVKRNSTSGYEEPYEVVGLRKDGSTFPILLHGRQIPYEGKIVRIASVIDLTDQKQAVEALRESEFFFSQMFEQSTISTHLFNPEGYCVKVNPAFCKLYGINAEDMTDGKYNIFEDRNLMSDRISIMVEEIFNERKPNKWDGLFNIGISSDNLGITTTKRTQVHLEVFGYPILESGSKLKYVVLQTYDITKRM